MVAVLPVPIPMVKPVEDEPDEAVVVPVEKVMVLPLTTSVEPSVIAPAARSFEVLLAVPTSWVDVLMAAGVELSLLTAVPVEVALVKAAVMVPVEVAPANVASV